MMPRTLRVSPLVLLLLAAACGGEKKDAAPAPTPEPVAAPTPAPTGIDMSATRERAKTAMFVPAPSEFQAALKASGATLDWKSLITDSDRPLEGRNKPMIALETGRRIANLLLTVQDADKPTIERRMKAARDALTALGAPDTVLAEVDKVLADFTAGSIGAAELVPILDMLSHRLQGELAGAGEDVATLVQAGGWVQAVNLLATGLDRGGITGDAALLMRQPTVLSHFMEFLKKSAPAQGNDPDVLAVLAEMEKLSVIAAKPELVSEDVKAISIATTAIVGRF